MDRKNDVFAPPPEELRLPEELPVPAPELTPPPEEFPPPGIAVAGEEEGGRRRRLRRCFRLAAAAALVLLLGSRISPSESVPFVPDGPSPISTEAPSPAETPEATPEPTPEPTPEQDPSCEIIFFSFSHAHQTFLQFQRPEAFREVDIEIWEPILDIPVAEYSLGPEEIASGELSLPMLSTGDIWEEHRDEYNALDAWPSTLELRASLRYETAAGEVSETRTLTAAHELGWSVSYWPEDYTESTWVYPGCFVFSTYESDVPIKLVVNDPDAVEPLVLSATLSIDGREIPADSFRFKQIEEEVTFRHADGTEEPGILYYAFLIVQKPDWAPESGTVHATVVQFLEGCERVWTSEADYRYTPEGMVYD